MPRNAFDWIKLFTFLGLLLGVTGAFLYLIADYLMVLMWAVVLAIVFHPLRYHLTRAFYGYRTPATITTMLIALLTVFVPISIIGGIVASESVAMYQQLSTQDVATSLSKLWELQPVQFALEQTKTTPEQIQTSVAETLRTTGSSLAQGALGVGAQAANIVVQVFVMLYILFFLLRDGEAIGARMMRMLPLGDERELFLFERFSTTVRAAIKGTLIVSLIQGAIGGVLFAIVGVKSAALWGAVMAVAAIIPAAGPAVVWVPGAIILFFSGNVVGAIILALGGSLVIGTIDNVLRPILVGKDANMPDALILLSVLGGIATFGLGGVILGPVVAALFLAFWHLFEEQYHNELVERG